MTKGSRWERPAGLDHEVPMNVEKLIRTITHALRHDPEHYGLTMTPDGRVGGVELLRALRRKRRAWRHLTWCQVLRAIEATDPGRFQITHGLIRAAYGHSIHLAYGNPQVPPETLLHATTATALAAILREGLKPMRRRFAHLRRTWDTRGASPARGKGA